MGAAASSLLNGCARSARSSHTLRGDAMPIPLIHMTGYPWSPQSSRGFRRALGCRRAPESSGRLR
eukprot:12037065-Alexandrium_andersonii.AAC.1